MRLLVGYCFYSANDVHNVCHMFVCVCFAGIIRTALADMDREAREHYSVVIQAKDMVGQVGGLSGSTTINITLTDVNDNPPKFPQSEWCETSVKTKLSGNILLWMDISRCWFCSKTWWTRQHLYCYFCTAFQICCKFTLVFYWTSMFLVFLRYSMIFTPEHSILTES